MTRDVSDPVQSVPVYRAEDIAVVDGANLGDPLSFAADLVLDDDYMLADGAARWRLSLVTGEGTALAVGPDTAIGRPGATLHVDSCLTLIAASGETTELLVLVEVDARGDAAAVHALPLAPLEPRTPYTLVGIEREAARRRLAEVACVSFARGTRITLATGTQKPIEALAVGDPVLTRDDGPQRVRWIGQSTMRAIGAFAPIRIRAGALHNANDLLVSPDHRLFIYQRSDALGAGRHEVLVRARHLVNGTTVIRDAGGFIDYFQLLFDSHQIVYAEGIAAETLLVDRRTRPLLPREVSEKLTQGLAGHGARAPHLQFEVGESLLDRPDAAEILRRASTR